VSSGTDDAKRGATEMLESTRRRLAYWDISPAQIERIERSGQVQKVVALRATASGHVLEKKVLPGQRIMAGEPLYKVADLSTVWVEGDVFEQDLPAVRVGETVRADFEALPGAPRTGRISYVYPTINPETRTARVRVVLPNGDMLLKPGMYATLRIAGVSRGDVLTVPREAVLSTGTRSVVFVREQGGALTPREVVLGVTSGERVEVLRGLNAGDAVVASATFLIDAESNLGKALGGMGDMPGMDVTTPPTTVPQAKAAAPAATPPADHKEHRE
jgi:membrane fusion protein, copper/silver efflux system